MEKKNIETITLQDAEVDKLKLEEEELVEEASSPEQPPEPEETLEDREQILTPARMVLKRFFHADCSLSLLLCRSALLPLGRDGDR